MVYMGQLKQKDDLICSSRRGHTHVCTHTRTKKKKKKRKNYMKLTENRDKKRVHWWTLSCERK